MAFSASLFRTKTVHTEDAFCPRSAIQAEQPPNIIDCIPVAGYEAALITNALFLLVLFVFNPLTCKGNWIKAILFYSLLLYNMILAIFLVVDTQHFVSALLLAYVVTFLVLWTADRIRLSCAVGSVLPFVDMRSSYIRVDNGNSSVVVPMNHTKHWFIRNFEQSCHCENCFYIHSSSYVECTFISRLKKSILVSVCDFSLGGNVSTVFVPSSDKTVPLHIIAPSKLYV
ncbi:hypothetical protein [Tylonycteris bat coronavirus HKU4]|uniref:Non-structural protein 3d n=4 Tax=Bat coronavirus HKU4 TaxID=694007 RepID=NS3D_BCHK4|nr:hypothetical protein BatCoVHKU4_gp6 [Tylonycteris bat coronavirus HKU4]A3EX98.1 RecName: Full=Non-structural protein 3d; Short=ns3d; AltName: Full=Accessory protein 3d [Tylonycteris bat coronavirus HKU4]ABN10852.1 hypothetical protein [Bat coronavirus HKU4-2]ABN10861.1 hypothetical protein [Bat coronavirus HKU4-3]ABN10843.1 hypothetical protein [Tylonycteris bat coronavirus HKU4]QQD78087.1 ORF5 [Tylonycteris bat coronavirus HKU4]